MIDTIFFLLVFFMITSLSMVQMSAKKVALPISTTANSKPVTKVVLTVDDKGAFFVDRSEPLSYTQVLPLLQEKVAENPHVVVVINCDRTQNVEQFEYALNIAKQANPESLMIATTPKTATQ
jgi:biopolymer transport protein ExbD